MPAEARHDPGYIFAQVHLLRHDDKIAEAAEVMLSAPRDLAQIHDREEWWVERRIMARKLLDLGDARSAYLVVADAAEPTKENSRVERHFMAGWIALRFLDDPATAATHFARIQDVSNHPTSLARSHYWLGRAAEAVAPAGSGARRVPGGGARFGCLLRAACTRACSGSQRSRSHRRRRRPTSVPRRNGWSSFARWRSSTRSTSAPWSSR